jgi:hypothetical protein
MDMNDLDLVALVRQYGVGTKLKRVVMAKLGWKHHDAGPPRDDWYRHWPVFSLRLEAATAEVKKP